jgi:hypothetical protein
MPEGVHNLEDGRKVLDSLPNLPKRIHNFLDHLENEPCTAGGACLIISNSRRMCAACRLRLRFFHTVYNAEAYDPTLGVEGMRRATIKEVYEEMIQDAFDLSDENYHSEAYALEAQAKALLRIGDSTPLGYYAWSVDNLESLKEVILVRDG